MLSPLDDFPIHQVAAPVRQVGTSDRNFYDRYYFNCHPCSDELFLVIGQGQYPNLGVTDAFALVRRGDEHRVVRASRELGLDRMDTSVGPFKVEVIEGLQKLRCTLDAAEHGIAYDLVWDGYVPAVQEPQHVDRNANGRVFLDGCRLAQLGSWTGWLEVDGERYDVTPDHWWGSRDRSWGIRPVGEPEAAGNLATKEGSPFRWLYAPFRMEDHALVFICQEGPGGRRVVEEAVRLWPDGRVDHLGRPEHDLQWDGAGPGLFGKVTGGTIRLGDLEVQVTPVLPVHIGVGTGYGFDGDGWKHGAYQGDLVVQGKVYDLADEADRGAMFGIVDAVAKFECNGQVGWGLFEHLFL
ncbi:MAG: hypothetical protein M3Z03_01125 [Actinomycetota bacterium]|nr:hypothetical protein [Actinomycetota bacterium]